MLRVLDYYLKNRDSKEDIEQAESFLLNNSLNIELSSNGVSICSHEDFKIGIDNESEPEIVEMQTQVLIALNEVVEMQYASYSSSFKFEEKDAFTIEQIRRITKNGKLLSFTNMFRELYKKACESTIEKVEISTEAIIKDKPKAKSECKNQEDIYSDDEKKIFANGSLF